ncbi:SulP family inorganic anion transporter [Chungangia koreensis]|uniref:SulP family inorganic anion transporter n=1 Tax=Chungangia koreensis TaxID=752657 RepID=A0ABV8X5Q5_9LACT
MKRLFTGRFNDYSVSHFQRDITSGVIVGVIAIPLAMAFSIASGVNPEYGLYTTIIAGIIISLLGGSKYQIGGPTGAFVPILFGVVITYGYQDLLLAGLMAGIFLCVLGFLKLGNLISYIPVPVTIGFTSGIAVIIFTGQIGNFFGLTNMESHEFFIDNLKEIISNFPSINVNSVLIAAICLTIILLLSKVLPKIPGSLVGLIVSSIIAAALFPDQVQTIGSVYGGIPKSLPEFALPEITWERIVRLLGPALAIAMLGGIESLLSAVVADGMTNSKHNSNRELIGQGVANIVTPLFGGIPATGAIARTATNIKSGAASPLSGVIHGLFVLLTLLLFAPYASHIPLASMAPILMMVAWNMSERKQFGHLLKMKSGDSIILLLTFGLTVFASITIAVGAGLTMAVILFVKRMTQSVQLHSDDETDQQIQEYEHQEIKIFSVEGPIFFGAAQLMEQRLKRSLHTKPKFLIIRVHDVPFIDSTGDDYLRKLIGDFRRNGSIMLISEARVDVLESMKKSGLLHHLGPEHYFETVDEAIEFASSQFTSVPA